MPRLTDQSYLLQHHHLRDQFLSMEKNNFFLLAASEQWDLFSYFFPHEQGSDELLLEHRATMTAFDRSLPHRAGRAYAKLQAIDKSMPAYVDYAKTRPRPTKNLPRQISVYGQVKPVLDPDAFVRIIKTMEHERLKSAGAADSPESPDPPGSKPS